MAVSTEVSLMDILFDRDDPVLKYMEDKEMFRVDMGGRSDFFNDKLEAWPNDNDLLAGILENDFESLEKTLVKAETLDELPDTWSECKIAADNIQNEPAASSDSYSDSGYSNGQQSPGLPRDRDFSPIRVDDDDDDDDYDDDHLSSAVSIASDTSSPRVFVQPTDETPKKKVRQVVKVSPMLASNPRSVLLPVNTANGVRTFKIVTSATALRTLKNGQGANQSVVLKTFNGHQNSANQVLLKTIPSSAVSPSVRTVRGGSFIKKSKRNLKPAVSIVDSDEEIAVVSDTDDGSMYPRLLLSPEERKLMQKEGVTLPTHYPLTKFEERELKRIRRKIRNKISAQDSRKRKKEYLDGLEDRVRQCTQENMSLVKRIKYLQSQNQSLVAQLKKLQTALAGKTTKTAQPATCLLVLLLSVALVMAPNLRLTQQTTDVEANDQDVTMVEKTLPPIAGRTRSLLSSESVVEDDVMSLEGDEMRSELQELIRFRSMDSSGSDSSDSGKSSSSWNDAPHFLADHDYDPPPSKRARHYDKFNYDYDVNAKNDFIAPIVDNIWPPPKIEEVLKPKEFLIPDVDDEWLPKSSGLIDKIESVATEVKVNISDGSGTRTVIIQVPKEKK